MLIMKIIQIMKVSIKNYINIENVNKDYIIIENINEKSVRK